MVEQPGANRLQRYCAGAARPTPRYGMPYKVLLLLLFFLHLRIKSESENISEALFTKCSFLSWELINEDAHARVVQL